MGRGRKAVPKVTLTEDRNVLIGRWIEIKQTLETIKPEEKGIREKLVAELFDKTKLEGSETVDIGWGCRLKATKDQNISATNDDGQMEKLLEAVGMLDITIASTLVRWKPELSTPVYRQLVTLVQQHPELAPLAAAAITVKPGMPQLEFIPAKAEETASAPYPIEGSPAITDGSEVIW